MSKISRIISQLLALAGLSAAIYLTRLHFIGSGAESVLCSTLSDSGCTLALNSPFATIAHIPLSLFLIGVYATLFLAGWFYTGARNTRPWAIIASILCVVILTGGIFLLGVMAESKSYCPLCLFMDGFNLILSFIWLRSALGQGGPIVGVKPITITTLILLLVVSLVVTTKNQLLTESSKSQSTPATAVPISTPNHKLTVEQCQDVELSALEISDFLCPYCKKLGYNLSNVLTDCGARVDKRFVHFPLDKSCNRFLSRDLHPGACRLAEASECARIQGKFTSFAAALFTETPKTDDALWALATKQELNLKQFQTCLGERQTQDRVRTDIELAHRLGVRATPTFYINGRRLEGALSKELLEVEISRALGKDLQEAKFISGQPTTNGSWPTSEPVEACGAEKFSLEMEGCSAPQETDYFAP
ncbi:MAG: thioredoxin domain-containing protein [Myxococcota bacterium]|nr:thioredoxin domain-containing protein [Myxococcota bacterium]